MNLLFVKVSLGCTTSVLQTFKSHYYRYYYYYNYYYYYYHYYYYYYYYYLLLLLLLLHEESRSRFTSLETRCLMDLWLKSSKRAEPPKVVVISRRLIPVDSLYCHCAVPCFVLGTPLSSPHFALLTCVRSTI